MFTKFPPALYKGLAAKGDGNLFMSPLSIQVALGMALAGAKGDTRDSLALALDVEGGDQDQLRNYRTLVEETRPTQDEIELAVANAAWVDERFNLKDTYLEALHSFGGDVQKVNYQAVAAACGRINSWVSDNTKTKIKEIVSPAAINSDTRLILTNAIYFKGKWQHAFEPEKTKPQDFYVNGKHTAARVPMMSQKETFSYFENDLYQTLELPYKGNTTSMLIVLPRKKDEITYLEEVWDDDLLKAATQGMRNLEVVVSVPKFTITTPLISLKGLLMGERPDGLGAGLAFSDRADFTGISDERLKIDDVLHKAFVEVGEEGTEAAAATAVSMMRCTAIRMPVQPKVFTADHPFLFLIRNCKTGNILFQGRVTDPR